LGVLSTALLIHLSWAHTARQNVADVAGQLNEQIVDSIRSEVSTALANAQADRGVGALNLSSRRRSRRTTRASASSSLRHC
jgi:hypothetical protein